MPGPGVRSEQWGQDAAGWWVGWGSRQGGFCPGLHLPLSVRCLPVCLLSLRLSGIAACLSTVSPYVCGSLASACLRVVCLHALLVSACLWYLCTSLCAVSVSLRAVSLALPGSVPVVFLRPRSAGGCLVPGPKFLPFLPLSPGVPPSASGKHFFQLGCVPAAGGLLGTVAPCCVPMDPFLQLRGGQRGWGECPVLAREAGAQAPHDLDEAPPL